ncbi:DUF6326 family protein [Deinococcus cellulosilyticus]|uniref:Uncharacterized protein n=1 Tax=Deinococcus cellulosilyticus (strain DSM 18568 / NBRC 106333 / KACC 11606 / 5516J-15) TaxID=1223518 RepID=A0A511N7F6_DEIC1|nr:DUF6326 family protein [Deinococcus cellulosilyticus]GEM48408.1 hypothetical protein DC3_40430 [Deinococcus cellulosilyticus NBRC 106333 = KACC 11606]
MTRHGPINSPFQDAQLPVQVRIAAAWTSFMLIYIYVDILNFYKPGVINGILAGRIWEFDIGSTLLTLFLGSVSIPAMMVWLSMTLPVRVNRFTNLIVATLLIPYSIFNAAGEFWDWAPFYGLSIGLELLLLAFILRSAWTWPRTHFDAAIATSDRLRQ